MRGINSHVGFGRKIFEQLWILKRRISETYDSGQSQFTFGGGTWKRHGRDSKRLDETQILFDLCFQYRVKLKVICIHDKI